MSKKILRVALPIAASFIPGVGPAVGSALGIGSTAGSALIGGGLSALTGGGLKGALLGAAGGALGANLGDLPGAALKSGLQGPTQGSGILGAVGNATGLNSGSVGGLLSGAGGGSTFSGGNLLANALGGYAQDDALKEAERKLMAANQQQIGNLNSFDPSGITSDPGYQFNLEQGQQGLNRSLNAGGNLFSGQALKAASEYNQNYANNAFNDYYKRWAGQTDATNNLIGQQGNIGANAGLSRASNLSDTVSSILNPQQGLTIEELRRLGL